MSDNAAHNATAVPAPPRRRGRGRPFEPGHPKIPGSGRRPGNVLRFSIDNIKARAVELGVDPAEVLLRLLKDPNTSEGVRARAAAALLPYTATTLSLSSAEKAIEQLGGPAAALAVLRRLAIALGLEVAETRDPRTITALAAIGRILERLDDREHAGAAPEAPVIKIVNPFAEQEPGG